MTQDLAGLLVHHATRRSGSGPCPDSVGTGARRDGGGV